MNAFELVASDQRLTREEARDLLNRIAKKKTTLLSAIKRAITLPLYRMVGGERAKHRSYTESQRIIRYINDTELYKRRFIFKANGTSSGVKDMYITYSSHGRPVDLFREPDANITSYLKKILREEIDGVVSRSVTKRILRIGKEAKKDAPEIVRAIRDLGTPENGSLFASLIALMLNIYNHRAQNRMDSISIATIFVPLLIGKTSFSSITTDGPETLYKVVMGWSEILKGLTLNKI